MSSHVQLRASDIEFQSRTPADDMSSARRRELEQQYLSVWKEFGSSLSRLAASYEAHPQAREDLLQEIRLAIWTALERFRGECSLRTFVYRIAHNRSLTHVWRRRNESAPPDETTEIADPRAGPESSAIQNARYAALMSAIRTLPITYRQVLTMALDELTQGEIAGVLGITENNVAVRLNRARKMLRERLGGRP